MKRVAIIGIAPQMFAEVLTGRLRCVNMPSDAVVQRAVYDVVTDRILLRVESAIFPETEDGERAIEYDLKAEPVEGAK